VGIQHVLTTAPLARDEQFFFGAVGSLLDNTSIDLPHRMLTTGTSPLTSPLQACSLEVRPDRPRGPSDEHHE